MSLEVNIRKAINKFHISLRENVQINVISILKNTLKL